MLFEHLKILWLIPPALVLLFLILSRDFVKLRGERWKAYQTNKVRKRLIIFALRAVVVTAIIVALAQPSVVRQQVSAGNPALTILVDNSRSFDLFDRQAVQQIKASLQNDIPVRIREIGSGNDSAIGDEILAEMMGNDNLLLVSDGRVTQGRTLGDIMTLASSINSTINALILDPIKSDLAVKIDGPRVTTIGIDNDFLAKVDQTPGTAPVGYSITVKVDGETVLTSDASGSNTFKFTKRFTQGYHQLSAEIQAPDFFQDNNIYYKTVKVEPKPKILLVTESSTPLETIFDPLYDLTVTSSIKGTNLVGYSAVVLNDIPASGIDADQFGNFVDDGNGVVVFGGTNSYDKGNYKGTALESLLPVSVGSGQEGAQKAVNIVLLIDISSSTGSVFGTGSSSTVEEVEKALAIGVLNDLRPQDRAGIVAFNTEPYTVSALDVLSSKNDLISKVQRLIYTGSTLVAEGLRGARQMLAQEEGSKSIVLFSDGKSGSMGEDIQAATYAAQEGIKVYTVGVGEETDREHMQEIAQAGNGIYFEPSEAQKLKIIFGQGETVPTDKMKLEKLDNTHFITKGISLNAKVTGFNQVVPKPNANVLVATAENRPILSVWRFGLGRIVSITTDDGNGWAAELLSKDNSMLLSRTVNWAVGDLSRNKAFDVNVKDSFVGQDFSVDVTSSSMPTDARMAFSKVGERIYTAQFTPEQAGWYSFFDATAAANYPLELLSTGYDPSLGLLVQATGGQTFKPTQTKELLAKVREDSKRIVTTPKSLAWIPLGIALAAFLIDILARKVFEKQEGKI